MTASLIDHHLCGYTITHDNFRQYIIKYFFPFSH